MKRLRARLTYANVMATIAVFIALGGASYAATQLPRNSVGAKQLKRGAVTPAKLSAGATAALTGAQGPQGPKGEPGAKGDPGAPATPLWAEIFAAGGIEKSSNAVSSVKVDTGAYVVEFDRDVSNCVYLGTLGFFPGYIVTEDLSINKRAVVVETYGTTGTNQDLRFSLAVFC